MANQERKCGQGVALADLTGLGAKRRKVREHSGVKESLKERPRKGEKKGRKEREDG